MAFSGDLKNLGLGDVFQNIQANRLTGSLRITDRERTRIVGFQEGAVVAVALAAGEPLPLAEHLCQRGHVNRERVARLAEKTRRSRKGIVERVVEAGLMTAEAAKDAVAEYVMEQVYDLFLLTQATFAFAEGEPAATDFDPDVLRLQLRLDTSALLMESMRRKDEWERIGKVVASDRDLFVALEGYAEAELGDEARAVAEHLDMHTDLGTLASRVPLSRFALHKAVYDLVIQGLARPCTPEELTELAESAAGEGEFEAAVRFLDQALALNRNDIRLRVRLAELYEEMGRGRDAAAEYAFLGRLAEERGDLKEAKLRYARATELDAGDPRLLERRLALVEKSGDDAEHSSAVRELADVLMKLGSREKAREVLEAAVARHRRDPAYLEHLAAVHHETGQSRRAAQLLVEAADLLEGQEPERSLALCREALGMDPSDQALERRVRDAETGAVERRRRRRLLWTGAGALVCLISGASVFASREIRSAHAALAALEAAFADVAAGRPAAPATGLRLLAQEHPLTRAGRTASRVAEELVELHLSGVERLLREGRASEALAALDGGTAHVQRADHLARAAAMQERAQLEIAAAGLLARAEQMPVPDEAAVEALARMTHPSLLDFHLGHVASAGPHARKALLRALAVLDSPRTIPVAARLFLTSLDPEVDKVLRTILAGAGRHREAGQDAEWRHVYPELERSLERQELALRAAQTLEWLRGTPAAPGPQGR